MKLIVGLGNPGKKYERTRHNFGFFVLDRLAKKFHLSFSSKFGGEFAQISDSAHDKIFLLKPQTFMNLSGESVAPCAHFYKILPQDMFVIFDDLDLPFGRLRVVRSGSDGGHNGVKSIFEHLGTQDFPRLKLGIGRPLKRDPVGKAAADHVLDQFSKEEQVRAKQVADLAVECVEIYLREGLEAAMNCYNSISV